nr:DNA recombination protein RmuC [bacterium]
MGAVEKTILYIALAAVLVMLGVVLARLRRKQEGPGMDELARQLAEGLARQRAESEERASRERMERTAQIQSLSLQVQQTLKNTNDTLVTTLATLSKGQEERMEQFSRQQEGKMEQFTRQQGEAMQHMQQRVEGMRQETQLSLEKMLENNQRQLERMRATVDEKLGETLNTRLNDSFRVVSERLMQVAEGLGEMRQLADGVGDLKKVLTNVKTRGTWGEVQLGNLLEQVLAPGQYQKNIATRPGSREVVEYAICLPGQEDGNPVYLPIDAKFPQEDYQRLMDAPDAAAAEEAGKALETRIKLEASKIREKYIEPPHTTDFAMMFLPTEGLYAEVLRRPGLSDYLQRTYKVVLAGPTTLWAILNSLQMGFNSLAIEKRSSEIWQLLGAVRSEFGKFGVMLDKTQKQLQTASNTISTAARKSRTIERVLRKVDALPPDQPSPLLLAEEGEEQALSENAEDIP